MWAWGRGIHIYVCMQVCLPVRVLRGQRSAPLSSFVAFSFTFWDGISLRPELTVLSSAGWQWVLWVFPNGGIPCDFWLLSLGGSLGSKVSPSCTHSKQFPHRATSKVLVLVLKCISRAVSDSLVHLILCSHFSLNCQFIFLPNLFICAVIFLRDVSPVLFEPHHNVIGNHVLFIILYWNHLLSLWC